MSATDQLEPTVFVIFGGGGDLTRRKLAPSLFDLAQDRSMPAKFSIIVLDRVAMTDDSIRQRLHDGVKQFSRHLPLRSSDWDEFASHIFYRQGDFKKLATYSDLGAEFEAIEKSWETKVHRIFYMATPPSMFGEIPKYLGKAGLSSDKAWSRIVVEKPIGYDLNSARELNSILLANFDESQIFRIDHYLGKETVQNMLAFRFANPLFEPIWDRRYVECVTITAVESVGVEHRGGYYDHAGALRDMVQNHLMQLLCLVAMEPMVSFDADEIRNKKVDVLHAVRAIQRENVHQCTVRGQYGPGWLEGTQVPGYRQEDGVAPDSQTETFVALRLFVDNWRWQDVPFYLRTGKRLARQASVISIQFRNVPHQSFPTEATLDWQSSRLVMSIQPDEGIVLRFQAKHPGPQMHLRSVEMQFNYQNTFEIVSPDAYETLLWDIMKNDQTLFMRADMVEHGWRIIEPVLEAWSKPAHDFPNYPSGSAGPASAQALLHGPGARTWRSVDPGAKEMA